MAAEMTAPTAAAAMATVIIEPKCGPRIVDSSLALLDATVTTLLQRIFFDADKICGAVLCRRVRTSSLRKSELFRTRSPHQSRQAIVSFDAAGLVIKSVLLIALLGELLADSPGLSPHRRIFDRDSVL